MSTTCFTLATLNSIFKDISCRLIKESPSLTESNSLDGYDKKLKILMLQISKYFYLYLPFASYAFILKII